MTQTGQTFSESWHRVADLHVSLRPAVKVRKQLFRGQIWYLLQDPFNNHFFRIRPAAHDFISRLTPTRSIAAVWNECLQHNPAEAPGQDDVIQLLAQLYHANLLYCDLPVDSSKLFERYKQRKQRENRSKLLSLMFFRIPLFDPEILLRRAKPLVQLLTGKLALFLWLLIVFAAVKAVIENFSLAQSEAKNLLAFDNLILLYCGLFIVKTLHEFGHTLICKRFGGEVHTIGVMLIFFTPLPYMDATSSWAFRHRRDRILVACAGMVYEFFAAGCAALIWANTGPGALHALAFNMMIVASVSTLIFNINPLLRYDGYYILSDILDIPNLQARAIAQLKHVASVTLFADQQSTASATSGSESVWLLSYGFFSGIYRVLVYGSIIFFIADRFLLIGLAMAVFSLFTWLLLPLFRFLVFLFSSPKLQRNRMRAVSISLTMFFVLILALYTVPVPNRFLAPGIVESTEFFRVVNKTAGQVTEVLIKNGTPVEKGTPLVQLANQELLFELQSLLAQREEILALQQQSITLKNDNTQELLTKRRETLTVKLEKIRQQQQDLVVTAESAGIWVAADSYQLNGLWLARGSEIGKLVSPQQFRFTAVIPQEKAAHLFDNQTTGTASVRLTGQANYEIAVSDVTLIPFEQEQLPSAALGWAGGGDIAITSKDAQGLQTAEPFFRIYASLNPSPTAVINHGHSGQIRFELKAEPLIQQMLRKLQQFLQKRYQI